MTGVRSILAVALCVVLPVGAAMGIPNPAYVFCEEMGYTVEDDCCVFTDGTSCPLWDFLGGSCGQEWVHPVPCAGAGAHRGVAVECCEGLVEIANARQVGPLCEYLVGAFALCSACGDGVCDEWENPCNCVEDCPFADCVGEGGSIPVIPDAPDCCPGLDLIPPPDPQIVGIFGYCTANCGNGVCDEIETNYNCPEDCPHHVYGACCLEDGSCVECGPRACRAMCGRFRGAGTTCPDPTSLTSTDVRCPTAIPGACCLADGTCEETTPCACVRLMGGVFQGVATTCASVDCMPDSGACCLRDGTCVETRPRGCARLGGIYQGDGVVCTEDLCDLPVPRVEATENTGCLATLAAEEPTDACPEDDSIVYVVYGETIEVTHYSTLYNCCLDDIVVSLDWEGRMLTFREEEVLTEPCYCVCCYDVRSTVVDVPPGAYTAMYCWFDVDTNEERCDQQTIVVGKRFQSISSMAVWP